MTDLLPFTAAELAGLKKTLPDCEVNPYIRVTLDRLIATIERQQQALLTIREKSLNPNIQDIAWKALTTTEPPK